MKAISNPKSVNINLRKMVLKRDKNVCYFCEKDKYLHIHHIDRDRSNNTMFNLITLCQNCHKKTHDRFTDNRINETIKRMILMHRLGISYRFVAREIGENWSRQMVMDALLHAKKFDPTINYDYYKNSSNWEAKSVLDKTIE